MSRVQSAAFAELSLNPDMVAGSERLVRTPGGNVAVVDTDPAVLKGFELTLKLCGMPLEFMVLMAVESLWSGEVDPDIIGGVLRNEMTEPCALPFMLELWSKNAAAQDCGDGVTDPCRFVQWVLPLTARWEFSGALGFDRGPLEITLKGYATANDRWYPSFPSAEFPSYVNGAPIGPAPQAIPAGILPDEWELSDMESIRAGGPLGWRCVTALPTPLDECGFVEPGCSDSFTSAFSGSGLLATPPYDPVANWIPLFSGAP